MTVPTSTYRLQVSPDFDLDAAAGLVDYLRRLGVGALYTSPMLEAASPHGYDVTDPTQANPALGGEPARLRLVHALRAAGLGLVVDVVPNHMSTESPWWRDVLAHGPASKYASYFDIDFAAGPILLPVLGDEGSLELRGDTLAYYEHEFPLAPETVRGTPEEVHEQQHYRLVHWRRGNAELTYRRFFDVPTLAAVRVEDPDVFAATHGEILRWVAAGEVSGIRVDHPDGLAAPGEYLRRLHEAAPEAWLVVEKILAPDERLPESWPVAGTTGYDVLREICGVFIDPAGAARLMQGRGLRPPVSSLPATPDKKRTPTGPLWTTSSLGTTEVSSEQHHPELSDRSGSVEIGPPGERMVHSHGVHPKVSPERPEQLERPELSDPPGTLETGGRRPTEVTDSQPPAQVNAGHSPTHSVAKAPKGSFTTLAETAPPEGGFAAVAEECRRLITRSSLAAEMRRIANLAGVPAEAVAEIMIAFPVYRSYLPEGLGHWTTAINRARELRPDLASAIGAIDRTVRAEPHGELATRIQQTSGMVVAKGDEDTASYRYTSFVALNEVGGDPDRFGLSVEEFHATAAARPAGAMTTLSTHDTKRSEDVRARLAVLSEVPDEWADNLSRWSASHGLSEPALNLLAWQTLAGAWPITADRLAAYLDKAAKEAKLRTSWVDHDEEFEAEVQAWPAAVLGSGVAAEVAAFVERIAPHGWANSLGQKIVQLAGPGVPDVYQGTDLFELSLVDPDNRRPVDFARRTAILDRLEDEWLPDIDAGGAAKLHVVRQVLLLRRDRPALFTGYHPLTAHGPAAGHALAFARGPDRELVVVATRLPVGLARAGGWRDTELPLTGDGWRDLLTGHDVTDTRLGEILARYPVALLVRGD